MKTHPAAQPGHQPLPGVPLVEAPIEDADTCEDALRLGVRRPGK